MKTLESLQHFSHYKSMDFFPDAPGQLTPQPEVGSGSVSNPSEILWLPLLSAENMIQLKIKTLERSQV